jgi:hypothetical protein
MASPPAPSYSASSEAKSSSSSFSSPAPALINDPSNELQDEISYLPQHNHHESFTSPPLDNAHDTRCDPDEKAHDDDREERGSQAAASDEASLLSRSAERRFKLKLDMMRTSLMSNSLSAKGKFKALTFHPSLLSHAVAIACLDL